MLTGWRFRVVAAAAVSGQSFGCSQGDPLPEPRGGRVQFECYPVEYMRPPQMPILTECPLAHPELAGTYAIVLEVGVDGSVLSATLPGEPSESVTRCLRATVGTWQLEPARTCTGEALPGEYRVEYGSVFGLGCPPFPFPLPPGFKPFGETASGRTSGCS